MTILNVPRMSANGRVAPPATSGEWAPLDGLDRLAASLEISAEHIDLSLVKPSPVPWGQVKVFEAALFNPDHIVHAQAVGEWRAMLALLALRQQEGHGVSIEEFPLVGGPDANGAFASRIRAQATHAITDLSLTWDPVHLIHLAGRAGADAVVGILSPTTIVAPSRSFRGGPDLNPSWLRGGLKDPLKLKPIPLTSDQLKLCYLYVDHLSAALRNLAGAKREYVNPLLVRLDTFSRELKATEAGDALGLPSRASGGRLVVGAPSGSLFDAANAVWATSELKESLSDVWVMQLPGGKLEAAFSGVVLADPRVKDSCKRESDRISLLDYTMLSQIERLDALQLEADRKDGPFKGSGKGVLVLRPEDILSDNLTRLAGLDTPEHPRGLQDCLLPLKPVALLFGSIKELMSRLEVRDERGGSQVVSLRLTLRKRNGELYEHSVEREYVTDRNLRTGPKGRIQRNDDDSLAEPPVNFAAWPDFQTPKWKWNYFLGYGLTELSAHVTTGVSAGILLRDIASYQPGAERRARLEAWGAPSGPWKSVTDKAISSADGQSWMDTLDEQIPEDADGYLKRLQRSDEPFEAGLLSVHLPGMNDLEPVYAGVGVLPRAEPISGGGGEAATLAIDFGTTNTTIYATRGSRAPEPMTFKNRLRSFNATREQGNLSRDLDEVASHAVGFMPGPVVQQPFTTVVMKRRLRLGKADEAEVLARADNPLLWEFFAYFDDQLAPLIQSIYKPSNLGTPHFELKFAKDPVIREKIRYFLGHICLLSMAELVGQGGSEQNIRWWFSYPLAMADSGSEYKQLVRLVMTQLGVPPSEQSGAKKRVFFLNESEAARRYFEAQPGQAADSMLVLDIGGGTTDIALHLQDPVWSHSVKYAGSELMRNFLLFNRDFLGALQLTSAEKFKSGGTYSDKVFLDPVDADSFFSRRGVSSQQGDADSDASSAIINSKAFREKFEQRFAILQGTDAMHALEAGAYLMLGGLLYYVGMQVRSLEKNNLIDAAQVDWTRNIALRFAGRGATLFRKLGPPDDGNTRFARVCQTMFARGREDNKIQLKHRFSETPKCEAAIGMLRASNAGHTGENEGDRRDKRILGADLEIRRPDKSTGRLDFLDTEDVLQGLGRNSILSVDMTTFSAMLEGLREAGVDIDARSAQSAIATKARSELEKQLTDPKLIQSASPPFILLLQETQSLLYQRDGVTAKFS
jgi:hypothetical protein